MIDRERLPRALARAAELVQEMLNEPSRPARPDHLAGWAAAVQLLSCWHQETYEKSDGSSLFNYIMHDGVCGTACNDPCKSCEAITKFCRSMLGGSDE